MYIQYNLMKFVELICSLFVTNSSRRSADGTVAYVERDHIGNHKIVSRVLL